MGGVDVVPTDSLERLERLCLTVSAHDELRRRERDARRRQPDVAAEVRQQEVLKKHEMNS